MRQDSRGWTFVQLAVVIAVGAGLALMVPLLRDMLERPKASEAFAYLSSVRSAEERYHKREGQYVEDTKALGISSPALQNFSEGKLTVDFLDDSWQLTLTRSAGSMGYGPYTVSFNESGFNNNVSASTVKSSLVPKEWQF